MMTKKVIQGEDIVIDIDGKDLLHATSHTLKIDIELKELRTKNTKGKEKSPGDMSWSVDADAVVVIDPDVTDASDVDDIMKTVLSKKLVKVTVKSKLTEAESPLSTYEGSGYITSWSISTPAGDNATYNCSITGSGDLTPKAI